jgi:hypothetical protein
MKAEHIKVMIPYFWELFKVYLNDPGYFIKESDILADYFGRGEKDVKEFILKCHKKARKNKLSIKFHYKERLTYKDILNQL